MHRALGGFNATVSSCEKAAAWRRAGHILARAKAEWTDVISYQAAISACDRAEQTRAERW